MIDLTSLAQTEWHNYYAMVNEAMVKDRELPDQPTYGSALDSWQQMPDEIREVYYPPEQHAEVEETLRRTSPSARFF